MVESTAKEQYLAAFDAHADSVFRFCLVKTSDPIVAEDLTQEAFVRLWQAMRAGRELAELRGFLFTIARNLIIDWYRKHKSVSLDAMTDTGFEPADRAGESPETHAAHAEVLRVMGQLDQEDREVLAMRFVEGMQPKEIAETLGISANLASVRIHRALENIRSILDHGR